MSEENRTTTDQILDLLLQALQERQQAQQGATVPESSPIEAESASIVEPEPVVETAVSPEPISEPEMVVEEEMGEETAVITEAAEELLAEPVETYKEPFVGEEWPDELPTINLNKMLSQLAIAVLLLVIVINIPLNRYGTNLARAMPDEQALVVRDGLVFKGSGDEIYVLEGNKKRWISSLDAFEYYGYRWEQVNLVDDAFVAQFENGRPIHVLLKCQTSPHVYALEDGEKRWINNIETFQAEGYVWEDVRITTCARLQNIPDGTPIPPNAGDPPSP